VGKMRIGGARLGELRAAEEGGDGGLVGPLGSVRGRRHGGVNASRGEGCMVSWWVEFQEGKAVLGA
jgi:hypothetical protein